MTVSLAPHAPQLIFFVGALLVPFLSGRLRNTVLLILAALALLGVFALPEGSWGHIRLLGYDLTLLRVDRLSRIFGVIFSLNAFAGMLYAFKVDDGRQLGPALFYIASSLGAVFAGDLITLYVFWEIMAVASTFLILARQTDKAQKAAMRYILIHLLGGMVLLLGIIMHITQTGSTDFVRMTEHTAANWLMLIGILVNAAAVPFSSWLSDAYPESTVVGGVILSAYTTKTAVYALIRAYPGWEILIVVGCVMSLYGIVYALLENDMRRILAYSIINQVGFMVTGVGVGTAMALNGAAAHAFCHIIYKALLWMSAGSVLAMTGKSRCTDLGGLWKSMPLTMIFGTVGALAISAFPATSGFVSKSLIIQSTADNHLAWAWMILEIASAGVFLHAGIKFPYFVFFAKDHGLRPKEAPLPMLLAMGLFAFLCIFIGLDPAPLYSLLPFPMTPYVPYTTAKVVGQLQLLMFSALVFFLFLPLLKRTETIALDIDWFYRKGAALLYRGLDVGLNGLNAACARGVSCVTGSLASLFSDLPLRLAGASARFVAGLSGKDAQAREAAAREARSALAASAVPVGAGLLMIFVGLTALLAVVALS
ncbi:NADH/Ubiquinone/plastoquinone (complex I) [Desulfovibrio sp. X2]|uniref:Na(+)/H(+) antiporter subunit D n=1 Tax=Desulfovibrio sp. X2 TaxID=941449 RepID=UPI000358DCED|nr:Na(+)/H(+) antiporter subunit D [Desulfovibrio sp. X2]EPR36331.1 NADH/Ubiquinone/plastoquinone (complex I) [Desulfovibrio sp. X2]